MVNYPQTRTDQWRRRTAGDEGRTAGRTDGRTEEEDDDDTDTRPTTVKVGSLYV